MKLNPKHSQRLLQQIMEFRRMESDNLRLKVGYNNIVAFIKELCGENFYPLLQSKNITLNFQTEQDVIMACFDVDKLDKIIYNLLSSTLKYNYRNGMVPISLSQVAQSDQRYFMFKVENVGDGTPKSKLSLLFRRFYEGDYRKFRARGTGIGFSLTEGLVELHRGTISVQSVLNETTVFTVMIPPDRDNYIDDQTDGEAGRVKNESIKEGVVSFSELEVKAEGTNDERTHLLLVEDDANLLTAMTKVLGKSSRVSTAVSRKEVLKLLKESENVSLVITGYVMPEMNGTEFCRVIRNDITLSYPPTVMLTTKAQTEYYLEEYGAGADTYITKPVEMVLFTAQTKTLITSRKSLIQRFQQQDTLDIQELDSSIPDRGFSDRVISVVGQRMEDSEFSNDVFYDMMNVTQSTLCREPKSLIGMSPNEFIRDIRIGKACVLLLQRPNLQMADVAYMVGFTDPEYLSLVLKKEKGVSPTKYLEAQGIGF